MVLVTVLFKNLSLVSFESHHLCLSVMDKYTNEPWKKTACLPFILNCFYVNDFMFKMRVQYFICFIFYICSIFTMFSQLSSFFVVRFLRRHKSKYAITILDGYM